jgi:hypothetical protein
MRSPSSSPPLPGLPCPGFSLAPSFAELEAAPALEVEVEVEVTVPLPLASSASSHPMSAFSGSSAPPSSPSPSSPAPFPPPLGFTSLLMLCTRFWMRSFLPFLSAAVSSSLLALAAFVHSTHQSRNGGGKTRCNCSRGSSSNSARVAAACCASLCPTNSCSDSNLLSAVSPVSRSVSTQPFPPSTRAKVQRPSLRFCRCSSSCLRGVLPDQLRGTPARP